MLRTRVIPALLLDGLGLVKTINFNKPSYIGDAANSCRIYNQMEVDELVLFDIRASSQNRDIQLNLLESIVSECFMPICYGGGVKSLEDFHKLFFLGIEKISVSSLIFENPEIIKKAVKIYGSQSIVATLDIKKSRFKREYKICVLNGRKTIKKSLNETLCLLKEIGFGELIINNIDRDGTWEGFDCDLVRLFSENTDVPVIALGGGGNLKHVKEVVKNANASAVALGSMAVFQKKDMGVLINFPDTKTLDELLR